VTGEDVPLDERFYKGRSESEAQPADPSAGGTGDGAYVGYEGETWHLVGEVKSTSPGAVQIDVNEPDPAAPGGQRSAGKVHINEPGPFELDVPKTVLSLRLQAFQDPEVNGPDEADPFAEASLDLHDGPPAELILTLVKGGRGQPGLATGGPPGGAPGAAPGAGPGDVPGGAPPPPPSGLTFPAGTMVELSGTVTASRDLPVVLDFFHDDGVGAGGRTYLGRRIVPAGAFSQAFPAGYGPVEIEAYQDLTGDSRTGDDPAARMTSPVVIAGDDVGGISLAVP
jgi:hypothetical protein